MSGKDDIQAFSPSLYHYIGHLHIAVSGFIAATGVAVLFLVAFGVRRGHLWAWVGAVAAPVLGLAVALPAHYPTTSTRLAIWDSSTWRRSLFVAGSAPVAAVRSSSSVDRRRQIPVGERDGMPQVRRSDRRLEVRDLGSEADEHDIDHLHAGSDRYRTLLCRGCGEADVHCACS